MPQERQEKRIDQLTHLTTVPDDAKIPAEYNGVAYYVEAEDIKGRTETELTTDIKNALLTIAQKVAYIDQNGQTYYNALYNALYPPASLVSISAVFTQGNNTVYDTDTLDSLKQYLTVTALYDDQTTATVTNYTLSGTLTAGTSTITVSYGGKTTTFTVTVTHRVWAVTSISAVFNQGSAVIYDNASLDSLRQYLTVTVTYENSSTGVVTDYTLSGTLTAGTSTITVSFSGKTDTFNVTVTQHVATLVSISAAFAQGDNVIYDTDSLDALKPYLMVTAHYDDDTDVVVSNYTLSGELTAGASTVTVGFEGKTATFNVTVTEKPHLVFVDGKVSSVLANSTVTTRDGTTYSVEWNPEYTGTQTFQNCRVYLQYNFVAGKTYQINLKSSKGWYLYETASENTTGNSGTLVGARHGGNELVVFSPSVSSTQCRIAFVEPPATMNDPFVTEVNN